jgi:tetratricopeptide (TPR) repeat protein
VFVIQGKVDRWLSGMLPQNRGMKILWLVDDADSYAANGDHASARTAYQKAIQTLESKMERSPEETQLLGRAYFGLGIDYLSDNNRDAAFQSFVKADVCQYPLSDQALITLAEGFAKENRKRDAIEYYIRYTAFRKPSDSTAKKVYALLESCCYVDEMSDRSYIDTALSLNNKVISANPNIDWAYFYLGMCYFMTNEFQNAEQYFERAMNMNPYWRSRQYYLGRAYLGEGNFDLALSTLRTVVVKEPGNADASFLIGKILIDNLEKDSCGNCGLT